MVVGIERFGATGGASSSPTKSERDSAGLGGLVRIGNNPSGSRPILLGDSTSPLTRDGHGCPKLNAQRLCKDAKPTERSYGKDVVRSEE